MRFSFTSPQHTLQSVIQTFSIAYQKVVAWSLVFAAQSRHETMNNGWPSPGPLSREGWKVCKAAETKARSGYQPMTPFAWWIWDHGTHHGTIPSFSLRRVCSQAIFSLTLLWNHRREWKCLLCSKKNPEEIRKKRLVSASAHDLCICQHLKYSRTSKPAKSAAVNGDTIPKSLPGWF